MSNTIGIINIACCLLIKAIANGELPLLLLNGELPRLLLNGPSGPADEEGVEAHHERLQ